jgi:hypothetical protein
MNLTHLHWVVFAALLAFVVSAVWCRYREQKARRVFLDRRLRGEPCV